MTSGPIQQAPVAPPSVLSPNFDILSLYGIPDPFGAEPLEPPSFQPLPEKSVPVVYDQPTKNPLQASTHYILTNSAEETPKPKQEVEQQHAVNNNLYLQSVTIGKMIGSGEFGTVFLGDFLGTTVALKSCKSEATKELEKELEHLQ
jgi:hypothetical protein